MKKTIIIMIALVSAVMMTGCLSYLVTDAIEEERKDRAEESIDTDGPIVAVYELSVDEDTHDRNEYWLLEADKSSESDDFKIEIESVELYQDYDQEDGFSGNYIYLNVTLENTGEDTVYYYYDYNTYILLNTGELAGVDYTYSTDFQSEFEAGDTASGVLVYELIATDIDQIEYIKIQLDGARDDEGLTLSDDKYMFWFIFELDEYEQDDSTDYAGEAVDYMAYWYTDYTTSIWSSYPEETASSGSVDVTISSATVLEGYEDDDGSIESILVLTYVIEFDTDTREYFDMYDCTITFDGQTYYDCYYEYCYSPIYIVEGTGFYAGYISFDVSGFEDKYFDSATLLIEPPYVPGEESAKGDSFEMELTFGES